MTAKRRSEAEKPVEADEAGGHTLGFEESIGRLEQIVNEMEDGKLSLEEMLKRFEEGQGLIQVCTRKLNEVEKRVELLVKKSDRLATEPFDTTAAQEPDTGQNGFDRNGEKIEF